MCGELQKMGAVDLMIACLPAPHVVLPEANLWLILVLLLPC
jgi:hypothetical protein